MRGKKDYKFAQKEHYRGWIWNRLAERVNSRSKAKVLYLPGPKDEDRAEAIKRGFKNHNLIAIDENEKAIQTVRKAGGIGVCSQVENILAFWKSPIDILYLDTCSSFTFIERLILLIEICPGISEDTILAFNCVRGRENWDRTVLFSKEFYLEDDFTILNMHLSEKVPSKHRGAYIFMAMWALWQKGILTKLEYENWDKGKYFSSAEYIYNRIEEIKPQLYSYKSGKIVMDCLITGSLFGYPLKMSYDMKSLEAILYADNKAALAKKLEKQPRLIAAAQAISTMKKKNWQPSSVTLEKIKEQG